MSDLFHEEIPDEYIRRVFDVIRQAPQHTFQVLTERVERMAVFFKDDAPPKNAWLGVTVEDREYGVPCLDWLRQVIRFVSVEPLLEDLGKLDLTGIHWVIVGGESGPKARPMQQEWVLNIKRQCDEQRSAFFFKQ
jgi:protein gp37